VSRRSIATVVAGLAAMPTLLMLAAAPAAAAGGGQVQVSNTETVQAYLDATGKVDVARVYEQVAMQGTGTVNLQNPVEAQGLRNLDGFGGFEVKDGVMVGRYDVDGEQRLRTVSDYTKKLPLEVQAAYTLDGKTVDPGDLLGRSGRLEVRYTVKNVTGTSQVVTFDDGTGKSATATQDVVIPMVGSLSTTLPGTFTNVSSKEANVAGDGRGGTKLTFTMTLFGPIGTPTATFGYSADIVDGTLPKASVSALPVSPLESPSFKGGAESYKGGATTGATLTAGATEIDANLLKLRDGAGTLLAGLIQLRDGAKQLDAGLGAQALPGSKELATGAGQLKDGTTKLRAGAGTAKDGSAKLADGARQVADGNGKLDDGAQKLSAGAAQVDDGAGQVAGGLHLLGDHAPELLDGLAQVADGLDQVDAGLTQLYDGVGGLPEQAKPLHAGIAKLRAGLGGKGQTGTLIDGVDQIRAGLAAATAAGGSLDQLKGGVDQSRIGVDKSKDGVDQSKGGVGLAKGGVDQVHAGLEDALKTGGGIDQLSGGVAAAKGADCIAACQVILGQVQGGLADLRAKTTAASTGLGDVSTGLGQVSGGLGQVSGGLGQVSTGLGQVSGGLGQLKGKLSDAAFGLVKVECGLSNTTLPVCDSKTPGLLEGVGLVDGGVSLLVDGVVTKVQGGIGGTKDTAKDKTLRGGMNDLQTGVDLLGVGGLDLLDAVDQLTVGADQVHGGTSLLASKNAELATGAAKLAKGSGDVATGAGKLDNGLGDLADGTGQLDDGAGKLADGAGRLSDGLADAASGTSKLAAGLTDAAAGAPALKDGAQRLSDEGTKKLVAAGKQTAADYGQKYALIEMGARRAKAEGMAYGAPQGAIGATAYSLELAGVDGAGSANLGRAAAAAGVFGLAGGTVLLRRRLL
jgi:putative membrane protein